MPDERRRRAAVAFGSNLGDRLATLQRAHASLGRLGTITATSSLYATAPVGGPEQGEFLNAVVVLDTLLDPERLLERLHSIEAESGRRRSIRWGPRTLDLDLIAVVDPAGNPVTSRTERLHLPHPRTGERRFVLEPLAEVWPEAPVGGSATAADRLPEVADQEVEVVDGPTWAGSRSPRPPDAISVAFVAVQFVIFAVFAVALVASADEPRLVYPWALAVSLGGLVLGLWASRTLGSALSPFPEPVAGADMTESGPYRWVRHPIYTGIILFLGGVGAAFAAWWSVAVVAVLAVFFWFKAGHEERRLRAAYPGYEAYADRVRGRLVPRGGVERPYRD